MFNYVLEISPIIHIIILTASVKTSDLYISETDVLALLDR